MAQAQPSEKLHTACDECRTRKLKCSGEKPLCGRCQREHIECVYSPQKTMGRPRKRRREEAGAEAEGVSATLQNNGNDNFSLDMPAAHAQCFNSSLGLASPPEHADVPSGNEVYAQAQIDPSLAGLYGPQPPLSAFNFDLTPAIDPSLWDSTTPNPTPPSAPSPNGPCTCLSLTYLTLTDLQTVSTFSFPQVIIPLRRAMSSVSSLLHCPTCPQDPFSAIQNVASLASLFKAIISRFAEVLGEVDREAASLRATGAKKPFRIGDLNPALQHLHTGTLDCPMGFNVELEPDVWVKLVKQALRTEMFGGGSNATPLEGLLSEVEERQQNWHRNRGEIGEEGMKVCGQGEDGRCERDKGVCEGLGGEHIRRAIGGLKWD